MTSRITLPGLVAAAVLGGGLPAVAQPSGANLGTVHFETSCTPEAAAIFDKGMLYQHSFWYRASQKSFEAALKADPGCGIAYWGIALSLLWNPHTQPPPQNWALGAAALAKGREVGARTERERDYMTALAPMYTDVETVDQRTRVINYMHAMERLAAKYPADDEAQIYYALALNVGASPSDKTYANQLKGAAILEKIWDRQPNHPGIAHYLIHLYDTPALAAHGLPAALRYAKVAPDAPHALHMPSHIFTRVGYWQDSINSNIASARAAKADHETIDQLHAMDYEVYAYLQLAQDARAKAVIAEMADVTGFNEATPAGPFALMASPARYAVERGDWAAAAALPVRTSPALHVMGLSWFAKGLGAARSGDVAGAEAAAGQLAQLRDQLRAKKDGYWAEQVDIQHRVVAAWALLASGHPDEARTAMATAADAEDETEKSPVTPGPLAPARELLGAMLLQQGRPAEALTAFEATMKKEPNRLNATLGASEAAAAAGNAALARRYAEAAVAQTSDPSVDRPSVIKARAFLAAGK
jgi:tetratricopeptide (TPR) repeat protein